MIEPAARPDPSEAWPADAVERRRIDDLIPYARNSRTHTEAQVTQLAGSLKTFGLVLPILVAEDGEIIAGHARVMAARKLGWTDLTCVVARGWSKTMKQAYVIADNKLASNAGWDNDMLRVELEDLRQAGTDLHLVGFDPNEIAELYSDGWDTDIDVRDRHGENLDGIEGKVVVRCPRDTRQEVLDAVNRAVDDLGLEGITVE